MVLCNGGKVTKIVVASGGFDPIRSHHLSLFMNAAKLGDWFVVIINRNHFLQAKKGFYLLDEVERMILVERYPWVDETVLALDKDLTVCETLRTLKPHIFVNGGDRKNVNDIPEAKVCEELNIEMVFNVGIPKGDSVRSGKQLVEDAARSLKWL